MGEYGFPKENRLRSSRDFERVYREGRLFQNRYFRIFYRKRSGPPRLGLVVSRKLGKAVVRNRAKRIIREAFRLNKDQLENLEVIVQLRAAATRLAQGELREQFLQAIGHLPRDGSGKDG
ncbi:MAG: ribonuclease P protein component [Thermoplasmata archaeon]|nr:ribonuclease P protein component [Thermoplasmata archaeon]NIY04181.1 ribonuclease P protein component [Thermoplasmata archaeon]